MTITKRVLPMFLSVFIFEIIFFETPFHKNIPPEYLIYVAVSGAIVFAMLPGLLFKLMRNREK